MADEIENEVTQITLDVAKEEKKDAEIGDYLIDPLPPIDFGRIAAQTAKQVIVQKVREAERKRQFAEFKDRVGEVINGVVKRVEFGNVIVDGLVYLEEIKNRVTFLHREHNHHLYNFHFHKNHFLYQSKWLIKRRVNLI